MTGVGGACAALGFEPPSGYWCNANPPRGSEYSVKFPSGLGVGDAAFDGRKWKAWKPNETVINAFRQVSVGLFERLCVCVCVCVCAIFFS